MAQTAESTNGIPQDSTHPLRLDGAEPIITVDDIDASIRWYRDVIGFAVVHEWRDDTGDIVGATVQAGNVSINLGQDDFAKGRDRQKGVGFRIYCQTSQDVDAVADGIRARGGVLDSDPTDQPWGSRDFSIIDPDGFKISISRQGD